MAKAEWGLKRVCAHCGTRYYDMKKNPPVCPGCGAAFDPESIVKSRRGRATPKPAAVEAVEDVILPAAEGEEAEEAVIEDAEELGEDGAVEVVEVEDET